jgi:methionine biosynthesis protein MetW
MIATTDPDPPTRNPEIAIISWQTPEAAHSSEFRFAESHLRRSQSRHPMFLSSIPAEAGIEQIREIHPELADIPRWVVIRSPMALLPPSIAEDLSGLLNDRPDLVCIASSEAGIDHPEDVAAYPYYTWRGFVTFREALRSRPADLIPGVDRAPFAFILDHRRVPQPLRREAVENIPRSLPTNLAAVAAKVFVHPLADYYRYPRTDVLDLLSDGIESLLDVGCGYGTFGMAVREKHGCRVVGVELNAAAAAKAREVLDTVIEGDINDSMLEEKFDVVTVNDVLEHMENPERVLDSLAERVNQNGQLILSIPNVGHWSIIEDLLVGRWDYLPAGLLCIDHHRFFTLRSITSMLERTGWQPIRTETIRGPLPNEKREAYERLLSPNLPVDLESIEAQGYIIVAKRIPNVNPGA